MKRPLAWLLVATVAITGCNTFRNIIGVPSPGDPSVSLRSAEPRWLLVKNPRFGDVPSEPEYIWVEEDKVPTTFTTLIRGKKAIIAAPEVVARYGPPPGGGKISGRQGMVTAPDRPVAAAPARGGGDAITAASVAPPQSPRRGLVVWVDTSRVAIDLTAQDGLRPGSLVSLRRDRIPIVHPITGEMLGELDEEIATARVTELKDRFSVAEIQTLAQGAEVRVKDRVVPK
jgi:hypothetical protein